LRQEVEGEIWGENLLSAPLEGTADPCFLYEQFLFHEILFVEHGNGFLGFSAGGHFDEGESAHEAGLMVAQDLDGNHLSRPGKMGFEICFGCLGRKVADVYFGIHFFLLYPHADSGQEDSETGQKERPEKFPSPGLRKDG
jgi:hypothetical protein